MMSGSTALPPSKSCRLESAAKGPSQAQTSVGEALGHVAPIEVGKGHMEAFPLRRAYGGSAIDTAAPHRHRQWLSVTHAVALHARPSSAEPSIAASARLTEHPALA